GVNNTSGVALIEIYDVPAAPSGAFVFRPVENTVPASFPRGESSTTTATVTSQARPTYPFDLRRIGAGGEALVQFAIGTDGRVIDAVVLRSHDIQFADAAV